MKTIPNGLVSIGLCADTHYWPSGQNWVTADGALQLQGASDVLLTALVDDLAQAHLDLVLHLGDQTCGGGTYGMPAAEYQRALQQLYHAFATLDTPVHVLPGNHDSTPGAGNWSNFRQLWAVEQGCGMTIDLGPLRLVLLNTHGHSPAQIAAAHEGDPVYGWVDEAELERLEDRSGNGRGAARTAVHPPAPLSLVEPRRLAGLFRCRERPGGAWLA